MEENIESIVIIGENSVARKQKNQLKDLGDIVIKAIENPNQIINLINKNVLLIINLSEDGVAQLKKLAEINNKKASIIVIGNKFDANLLNIAIAANVSAFLDTSYVDNEILHAVEKVLDKISKSKDKSTFNVFINAKGGAGASFISSNMAYILSQQKKSNVVLLDMDLQFGSIGLNFNINMPKYTVIDALEEINELDRISLSGYMEKYNKSLSLLLPSTQDIVIPGEVNTKSFEKLLVLLRSNYDHLIIDLPKIIDPLSMMIMEKSDNIIIVLQQNLAQFRDGRRLIQIINKELEIPLDRIVIIINRYDKNSSLRKEDMIKLVNHKKVYTVANDFDLVATTSNLGLPLYEHSRGSKIAKDLKQISYLLGNIQETKKKGLFRFLGR